MAKIVPAILEITKAGFVEKLNLVTKLPGVERIQVDFGDGVFVPNKMLQVSEMDVLNPAFHFEAHLMVKAPEDFFDYELCGFKTIIIHFEAYESKEALLRAIRNIKEIGLRPGICINNSTPVSVLKEFHPEVTQFQLMGITPGFQGQLFLENTFERIKELRGLLPNAIIEIDGGVSLQTIKKLAESGADLLIAGSALVKQQNILDAYKKLKFEIGEV
jgi:ribulose-phosphate 3-epimerase